MLCGASAALLAAAAPALAQQAAQSAPSPAPTASSGNAIAEVVVTGTRVVRDGYRAPTPTSVIGVAEITAQAPANIADFVNELPSLQGSATPQNSVSNVSSGTSGINALNLRDLGENRTLVLLDGQRVGASTLTDEVDINDFPEQLIKRVDVVTGGASADWGSDAVAGVVNFVLDKTFTGFKGEVQGGATTYGDDGNYKVSLTGGTGFMNDRGHVLFSVEDAYNAGITGAPRPWASVNNERLLFPNPTYTATNGQPEYLVRSDSGFATATPGGIITSGPLAGTYFGPGGTPAQFNYGPLISGDFMQGGQASNALANSGDLDPRISRQNLFFRTSFDVTDHFQVFGQASYATASTREGAASQFNFNYFTVDANNAFLPASTAAALNAYNSAHPGAQVTTLDLGTLNQDLGPIITTTDRSASRFVIGANGDFDAFNSHWTWDAYSQESITDIYTTAHSYISNNYQAAINTVLNPTTGAIQCASVATNPTCVPYNIFGTGVNSPAAIAYVEGTSWGRTRLTQNVESATLHGNPISDWAGPISVATGVEYRREAVSGSNDPLSTTDSYFVGNYHATSGEYDVTEGFFETVIPLAKNEVFAKSLDLNGAVRETDYSTSGLVTTYKVGLTYTPIDDISFRVTRSHDIRAPNLSELFQAGQNNTTTFVDPTRGDASSTGLQVTSGNLNLKPEAADTTGVGVILSPRFLPGFEASVDYYEIHINNAITTLSAQQVIDQCAEGDAALCADVVRSGGVITQVDVTPVNLAQQVARGIDFEASYRKRLDVAPFLSGNLSLRFMATHYLENYTNNGVVTPTNNVGENGANAPLPNWSYMATASWAQGPVGLTFTARGISDGVLDPSYVQCSANCPAATVAHPTIENNFLPGALYFDASVTYKLPHQTEAFVVVDNIANTPPAMVAYGPSIDGAPISVNPSLYDVVGRTFRVGFRFKM